MRQKFVLPTHTVAPSIPVKNEVKADAAPLDTAPVANQIQTQELATLYPVPISPVSRSPPKAKVSRFLLKLL
jgi:hypothetical protein